VVFRMAGLVKKIYIYIIVIIILVVTCVFSALLALKMEERKSETPLEAVALTAHDSTLTLRLPFKMADDNEFNVDPDIRYYVKSARAFFGSNEELSLHVYSIIYRTEILDKNWSPDIENMADITIKSLQKNVMLANQSHQKRNTTIAGLKCMEVTNLYTTGGQQYVQRVLHIPLKASTWSLKAAYRADNAAAHELIGKTFNALTLAYK
jgi:hypothetical protein